MLYTIVEFDQKDWMAPYIEFNTERRKEARNDFETDFLKLTNCSVFWQNHGTGEKQDEAAYYD